MMAMDDLDRGNLETCYHLLRQLDPLIRDANKRVWQMLDVRRKLAIDRNYTPPPGQCSETSQEAFDQYGKLYYKQCQYARLLEDQQTPLRAMVNTISKPHLRPLRILDMPDEILVEIFENLAQYDDRLDLECFAVVFEERSRAKDIRNIRLTCHRFHNTGSHLLIRFVCLDCSKPSSLSRLQEIARHPMFSKGVETVRIDLGFYAPLIATDISVFSDYVNQKVSTQIDCAENSLFGRYQDKSVPYEQQRINVQKAKRIAESWQRFADGARPLDPEDVGYEDDISYRKLLEKGHREYQLRFATQESLNQDGNFVRAVAAAISKMPLARRLQFRAEEKLPAGYAFYREPDYNAMYGQLVQYMQSPMSWKDAEEHQLGMPPTEMLVQLPGAIQKAGASLTEISIRLENPSNLSALAHSQNNLHELTAAVQSLKRFRLHLGSEDHHALVAPRWSIEQPGESEGLRKFLQAILDSPRMERLNLTLKCLWDKEDPTPTSFSLGSFINLQPWKELKNIAWHGMPIHLAEMSRFLDQHAGKDISIRETYLLSGTWAEALDLLRQKAPHAFLKTPRGGELGTLSEKQILETFGSYSNKAEMYLRGKISNNPLRDPPDNEANEGEPSDEEADDDEADGEEAGGEEPDDEQTVDAA